MALIGPVSLPSAFFAVAVLGALVLLTGTLRRSRSEIIGIRIYPIKSCRGIEVKSAKLLKTGLDLDRNWMFVSRADRQFITIRNNPLLTLIRTAVDFDKDELIVTIEGNKDFALRIPAHPTRDWLQKNTKISKAIIWSQETDGWEYPQECTQPIADFLKTDLGLVYKGPLPRFLRGSGRADILGRLETTKFADMMPVQVSSMSSMNELNERLQRQGEKAIDIERFRPNIIIRGGKPWSEDNWKYVRMKTPGAAESIDMDVVCRCLRCQVPNVDPETGEKHAREPWTELMKYRRIDPGVKFKPSFGMLCAPKEEGTVTVGDVFEVRRTTKDHFFISPMK